MTTLSVDGEEISTAGFKSLQVHFHRNELKSMAEMKKIKLKTDGMIWKTVHSNIKYKFWKLIDGKTCRTGSVIL